MTIPLSREGVAASPAALAPRGTSVILAVAAVTFALYAGRAVFVPLALAVLLSVALFPVTNALQKLGLGRVPAVLVVLALALCVISGAILVLAGQAVSLAAALPDYETTLRAKLLALSSESDSLDRLVRMVHRLEEAITPRASQPASPAVIAVAQASPSPLATLGVIIAAVLSPAASLAIALLLLTFLLLGREDARDRLLRLAGTQDLHRTTRAMADATQRVGRYLLMQLVVNAVFGTGMGIGLWLIGLPNAPLWGLLGFALRFLPYVGAPLSVTFPLLIAVATMDGWMPVLLVLGLFAVVDIVCTYVLEPTLYGRSTGISPLALIISSALWTVVWGPVGLILAPPITACLVIVGRHVPSLAFLEVLFGDVTPLPEPVRFYQRLLAGDPDGAEEIAAGVQREHGTRAMLDQLVFPTLESLREDRRAGVLAAALTSRLAEQVAEATAALTVEEEDKADEDLAAPEPDIAVLPVGGMLDLAAAEATAAQLREAGLVAGRRSFTDAISARAIVLASMERPSGVRLRRAVLMARRMDATVHLLLLGAADATQAAIGLGDSGNALDVVTTHDALLNALQAGRRLRAAPAAAAAA